MRVLLAVAACRKATVYNVITLNESHTDTFINAYAPSISLASILLRNSLASIVQQDAGRRLMRETAMKRSNWAAGVIPPLVLDRDSFSPLVPISTRQMSRFLFAVFFTD